EVIAQADTQDILPEIDSDGEAETVTYPAGFFAQYNPLTALDMVQRVPGFQIDDGDDLRGFGSAAGNVLIDHRRPSTKQDLISAILDRIPAENIERIDLIRGQIQDIKMEGHTTVANVIMKGNVLATNRWETFLIHTSPSPLGTGGSVSLAHRWRAIDYNLGLDLARDTNGITGTVEKYDASNSLIETRIDDRHQTGIAIGGIYLNASSLLDGTLYNLNTKVGFRKNDGMELSRRFPHVPGEDPFEILFEDDGRRPQVSAGIDAERFLRKDLQGKAILVFTHSSQDATSTQSTTDSTGTVLGLKTAEEETKTTEAIARLEFDWFGWAGHTLMGNIEGAYNVLNNSLLLTEDAGTGPMVVNVPNANTRVEEVRGNILLKDTWTLGDWVWSYGLGAEVSTITQTGDTEQERSFFYLKPESLITYSPYQHRQSRLRIAREVSQLNFNDFVSTTAFVDDDLALGNPDLKPEATWITELT
ncbi:MAG: TonB-dependent receptor plug domain-containing protein, partial [Gammaproteobacteria bacterium]